LLDVEAELLTGEELRTFSRASCLSTIAAIAR